MTFPLFAPSDDPGPNFAELLRRTGRCTAGAHRRRRCERPSPTAPRCVAVRYADGVVMAGDRRATSGNLISHRADGEGLSRPTATPGWPSPAPPGRPWRWCKLFQLQLEHYEKVEGAALSLEGKANQLGQMVRSHLPAAMQGLAVVPLFAGYDTRRRAGRLFQYDVTGGRYEESDFAATGSGSLHAGTVDQARLHRGPRPRRRPSTSPSRRLFQAADEDSATGGPDLVRGHLPDDGHHHRRRLRAGARATRSPSGSRRCSTACDHRGRIGRRRHARDDEDLSR